MTSTTQTNPDGSSTVHIHVTHDAPPPMTAPSSAAPAAAPAQTQNNAGGGPQVIHVGIPCAMPMPPVAAPPMMYAPYPCYGYSYPHYQQQQQQPTVIVLNQEEEPKKKEEAKKKETPPPPTPKPPEPVRPAPIQVPAAPPASPPPPSMQQMQQQMMQERMMMQHQQQMMRSHPMTLRSPPPPAPKPTTSKSSPPPPTKDESPRRSTYTINSFFIFCIALIFGTATTAMTYEADYDRLQAESVGDEDYTDNEDYLSHRSVAIGLGFVTVFCFNVATICLWIAGSIYRKGYEERNCCLDTFMIAGGIIFAVTLMYDIIVLVLSFDMNNIMYPGVVVAGFCGSIFAWLLVLIYSEIARTLTLDGGNAGGKDDDDDDDDSDYSSDDDDDRYLSRRF